MARSFFLGINGGVDQRCADNAGFPSLFEQMEVVQDLTVGHARITAVRKPSPSSIPRSLISKTMPLTSNTSVAR